ncbi:uncharacterized protein LOC131167333 isoform X2 [Malania oleifera]|uniref:uncharacterized protein LOC131167333 isoform X2 n=1 Tax=Malania oleifera TaxID=397392 RepID=UPI0025ADB5C4|nr:uncharacterized protein LOC131167333 isoform X2 [Malania oleifera]
MAESSIPREAMEEDRYLQREQDQEHNLEITDTIFTSTSDLCQQLLDRYSKSVAPQHRHLCATAAAMRSILQSESLPLTPPAYFAASISAVSETTALDSTSAAALLSFLSITLPLVPLHSIPPAKAADAISVLVNVVRRPGDGEAASASTARAAVKCLGVLVGFCDMEDWASVRLGVETLVSFSVDRRPKVRKCAQTFVETVFRSFGCSTVIKEASRMVFSFLKGYVPMAVRLTNSRTLDGSKPEHLEVLHMLNLLKQIVPYSSVKVSSKVLSELYKLMRSQFSVLTRRIFDIIEVFFETSRVEMIACEAENIIISLVSYVSLRQNPMDTVVSAATLLKCALDRLHVGEPSMWRRNLPLVFDSIAGLLTSEASTASRASSILKELINNHVDRRSVNESQLPEEKGSLELSAIISICAAFENVLNSSSGIPNEHILGVISVLFIKLGEDSSFLMKAILFKLADLMALACGSMSTSKHLEECIGSAVIAMGPERVLTLLPINFRAEDKTCSNIWLVPILRKYVVGASLGYFMEHIVPLAESIQQAYHKVKKSVARQDLQNHAHELLGLLPAFCCHPTDTYQKIIPLSNFFITSLKENSLMHEIIAISIQELVKQNRSMLNSSGESNIDTGKNYFVELKNVPLYSKKTATRNVRALASVSKELLQVLTDVLFDSPPEKHSFIKDAVRCLASITDTTITKKIFISSLERFQLINAVGEFENVCIHAHATNSEEGNSSVEKNAQRHLIMELASSLIEGASEDLIDLIYSFVRHTLQAADEVAYGEAYYTLSQILEEHSWFCSSRYVDLVDFLLGLKAPTDIASLKSRYACFQILFVHALKGRLDDENTKAFLILNDIILTLKNSKEEVRKVAYDILLKISSSLKNSSSFGSDASQSKLISMIIGYLSGSSPQIKSGAVSALSVLVYKDTDICLLVPELVPFVSALLQSKALEVIKAVLGFTKVLVSCLQAKDLQNFLSDIISGVLPWSSVSRNHFRSKVTVILEIIIRKCGSAAVESVALEKYKGFVKSVMESRRGKLSKEGAATNKEPKFVDSSPKGQPQRKRTHKEFRYSTEENGSVVSKRRKNERGSAARKC